MSSPNMHKRLVYHWIGRHIEGRRDLREADRVEMYVAALRGSLQRGLWLNRMDEVLELGRHRLELTRRMVCLTESRLSECRFHSQRYGRLGLGFPKRFVLEAGGKPVTYVRHKRGDLYTRLLLEAVDDAHGVVQRRRLEYLAHFVKPMGVQRRRRPRVERAPVGERPAATPQLWARRQFGPRLLYLSEAEWRIVEDPSLLERSSVDLESTPERTYLGYDPGLDLMTVVFPDARVQQAALEDPLIRTTLRTADPPINLFHLDEVAEL